MKILEDINVDNKKVIVRVDYNVPIKNKVIEDDNRIKESVKTIEYLINHNAKIILMSHMGKVKEESDKEKYSLKIVADRLSKLLNKEVMFSKNTTGKELEEKINSMKERDVLLIENTRFEDINENKESSCDEELSKYWASLAEVFVMDAFGSCHRAHASTYGISKYLPSCIGFLVEKELSVLNEVLVNKDKDIILGGAKVDKLEVVRNLVDKSNHILIGGVMSFTFLKMLGYNVGPNFVDEEKLEEVKELYEKYKDKIILPLDFITPTGIKEINNLNDSGYDIGPKTIEKFKEVINGSSLVVCAGPLGKFEEENYENGTKEILKYLSENNIKTIIAGGDTGNAAHKWNYNFYYISTGGGATLEYLSGKEFKSLENMK